MNFLSESLVLFIILINSRILLSEETKSEISCSIFEKEYKLEAKGGFLKLSEILNFTCPREIKFIEIFALDRILIDEDLIKVGKEMQVNIISPVWEIVSKRTVNLNGADAVNIWDPRERVCTYSQKSIADGVPGLPGGPGGTFFGIMSTIINGKNLEISTNGGKGSNGQDGCKRIATQAKLLLAGKGGNSGAGGYPGLIELFSLKNNSIDVKIMSENGINGNFGKDGQIVYQIIKEGKLDLKLSKEIQFLSRLIQSIQKSNSFKILTKNENSSSSDKSIFNSEGYEHPRRGIGLEDFSEGVKRYREYVLYTIFNTGSNKYLPLFYQLRNSSLVDKNILYYMQELTELETYYSLLSNRSVYLSMLKEWQIEFQKYDRKEDEENHDYLSTISDMEYIVSKRINSLQDKLNVRPVLQFEKILEFDIDYFDSKSEALFKDTTSRISKIGQPLAKLFLTYYANEIIDEYKMLQVACFQYIFPFMNRFPNLIDSTNENITDPVKKGFSKFRIMKSISKEIIVGKLFQIGIKEKFGDGESSPSFYIWNSSICSSEIKDFLSGKKVKLFANISHFNAVKFRNINILVTSVNPEVNEQLQNDLKDFKVTLIHNGDSYYRCDDKVYLIKTGAYQFQKKFLSSRDKSLNPDEKFDFVFSPYATWSMQLSIGDRLRNNFDLLVKYVNQVQIELVGEGTLLSSNLEECKNDFSKYFPYINVV